MKSAFRSQYMVRRGREAELPPEESDRGRSEDLQEVQLEEYRSWSKGNWLEARPSEQQRRTSSR
jgi:hypothetical protein